MGELNLHWGTRLKFCSTLGIFGLVQLGEDKAAA